MKTKKYLIAILVLVFCLGNLFATERFSYNKKTLSGFKEGVRITFTLGSEDKVLENLGKQIGIPKVATDAELKMRLAGIKLIEDVAREIPGLAELQISGYVIKTFFGEKPYYFVHASVDFNQWVFLARDPKMSVYASTWGNSRTFFVDETAFADKYREIIGDMVDTFINDYLSVNPKERQVKE
jgi:hypothetical protein